MKCFVKDALVALVFFCGTSCIKSPNNVSIESVQQKNSQELEREVTDDNEIVQDNRSEEEKARDVVMEWTSARYNMIVELLYLRKVDFGIPRGENWLARFRRLGPDGKPFESNFLLLFNNEKVTDHYLFNIDRDLSNNNETQYDIIQDIPGIRLGDGSSAFDDYNGDGFLEIFGYVFTGRGNFISIQGYDAENDKIIEYCDGDIPFGIIDPINGPAPVEFMTYNSQYGFKVYYAMPSVNGGPDDRSMPSPDNEKWFFIRLMR